MAMLLLRPPSGAPIEFAQDRTLMGRDPSCAVVLEDKSVSRRHALVERRGESWYVVDQGSANGTFLDGTPVAEAELRDGQELRLGTLPLGVELESEMPQTILMSSPAAAAVSPDGAADADLPSAHPVLVPDALGDSLMEPVRSAPLPREPVRADVSGPPLATTLLGTVIVLMLGASGYFWMGEMHTRKDLVALSRSSEMANTQAEWQKYQPIDQLEKDGALLNGALRLCNRSAGPIDVAWLGAVHLEDPAAAGQSYTVKGYNSLLCRQDFKLTLPPGSETPVALESENERCRWNGHGVFYALYVRRLVPPPAPARGAPPREPIEQTVYYSGLLNGPRDCVNIGEGW
ncbi:MAG TPA: FHA domain-containing protein [Vicinamibacteria bacterium]|nr:FHA domain-containing protein [Vicinamibacteria bacterium]